MPGVPMLPVVYGDRVAARVILGAHGAAGAAGAVAGGLGRGQRSISPAPRRGGAYFLYRSVLLVREPTQQNAIRNFLASLLQLSLLLVGAIVDGAVAGRLVAY